MIKPYIIFSDLDGTLLDYHTYSFESALPALNHIKNEKIPLILVSSKTQREMSYYQDKLGLSGLPYVVENGSAIFTPNNYFDHFKKKDILGDQDRYVLGKKFKDIKAIVQTISEKYHYTIRGFHNASKSEIKSMTDLADDQLDMALIREFSIPIFFDERAEEILKAEIEMYGLKLLYGGRFMHLLSDVDKGEAIKLIVEGYKGREGRDDLQSIALGDSLNDFAMLAAADHSFLVKKHDGSYEYRQSLAGVIYSPGIGPVGWNHSLMTFLKSGGTDE